MTNLMTIVQYNNRKLYSRELSKYVNHSDIIGLYSNGYTIKFETKQGDDITSKVEIEVAKSYLEANPYEARKVIKSIF